MNDASLTIQRLGTTMIKAILFDAFGTLCEIRERHNPYKPILKTWPSGIAAAYQAIITSYSTPVELAREVGLSAQMAQKIDDDVSAEIASIRLFPDVAGTLTRIKKSGLKWGIISNLATPYAQPLLDLLPIAPDACIWSFTVGYRKPEKAIYDCACTALGLMPSEILIVGDSYENDFNTPRKLGMQAKFLSRAATQTINPDQIDDLSFLIP